MRSRPNPTLNADARQLKAAIIAQGVEVASWVITGSRHIMWELCRADGQTMRTVSSLTPSGSRNQKHVVATVRRWLREMAPA